MDAKQIDREHIIERYLANQLDEDSKAAFEAHYAQDPESVRAIERTLRLREGMAVLRERGELNSLVRARPGWALPAALAAALVLMVAGTWLFTARTMSSPLVASLQQLTESDGGQSVGIASTLVLARTRGPAPVIEVALPAERGAIELRMLASLRATNERYRVTVHKVDSAKETQAVGSASGLPASDEGFVTAYLDTGALKPGSYAIELVPERNNSPGAPSDRFVISLR